MLQSLTLGSWIETCSGLDRSPKQNLYTALGCTERLVIMGGMRLTLDRDILFLVPEGPEERAEIDALAKRATCKHLAAWTMDGTLLVRVQSLPLGLRPAPGGQGIRRS